MTRALDVRMSKLERRAGARALSSFTDAELKALMVNVGDALAAGDDDPDVTRMLRSGAASDGLAISQGLSMVETWRAWRTELAA